MASPFVVGLLAFGAGTYGFVPDLLKFLLAGKLLFFFSVQWWVKTWIVIFREFLRPIFVSIEVLLPQLHMLIENPSFV